MGSTVEEARKRVVGSILVLKPVKARLYLKTLRNMADELIGSFWLIFIKVDVAGGGIYPTHTHMDSFFENHTHMYSNHHIYVLK